MDPNKHSIFMKYLKKRIKRINKDYEIIESVSDGCDSKGGLYWVECNNGFGGRSWEVPSEILKRRLDIYDNISKNGFNFKETTYYYDHDKLKTLILTFYK